MTGKRLLIHSLFLFALPLIVAWYGLSFAAALGLVVAALLWRWVISISGIVAPAKTPDLELETISASHFVEKVRWCMDRLGVDYVERPTAGTLGAFFRGRTVPVLHFKTGAVQSSIGNSQEILRYLWGRYLTEAGAAAEFLSADQERLDLEKKIDRCGVNLQVWVYHHLLPDPALTLRAWGYDNVDIPYWQRLTVRVMLPLHTSMIRKTFNITPENHARAVGYIDSMLTETEALLEDGRSSLLGGTEPNYTDFSFAAIMGLWAQPPEFGGGRADSVRIEREEAPKKMREEIERWESTYPRSTQFINDLYRQYRKLPAEDN